MPWSPSKNNYESRLLRLARQENLAQMSFRAIGKKIGLENQPQTVKYYLAKLIKKGHLVSFGEGRKSPTLDLTHEHLKQTVDIVPIRYLGQANCGPATMIADQNAQPNFLYIASNLLKTRRDHDSLFALKAVGNSMNNAAVPSPTSAADTIDDGDFVIIDKNYAHPKTGDYIVSIINGGANIKKLKIDNQHNLLYLLSESTDDYPPIVINSTDDYFLNGKVVQVIKGNV